MQKFNHSITLLTIMSLISLLFLVPTAEAAELINDDLIVKGSSCIGDGCVGITLFGSEELILKDSEVKLKFHDTTPSPGITNDWQITINDEDTGSYERFSIEDIDGGTTPFTIEAGAPDDSLYVDEDGHVGIGTFNPLGADLHIRSGSNPRIDLYQDDSEGRPPYLWWLSSNHVEFWVKDSTAGTKPLKIINGAPEDNLVLNWGRVGIGTSSPDANLHLAGGDSDATFLFETDSNGWYMLNKNASGRFNITDDPTFARVPFKIGVGAQQNLMKIGCGSTDEVFISGDLIVAGTITPDYVFEDRYPLKSIEEHADVMWKEKHLPAVEKAKVDEEGKGVVNLGKRSQELLEELETAHIYIQQLNQKIKNLESVNDKKTLELKLVNKRMKEIEKRLAKIES